MVTSLIHKVENIENVNIDREKTNIRLGATFMILVHSPWTLFSKGLCVGKSPIDVYLLLGAKTWLNTLNLRFKLYFPNPHLYITFPSLYRFIQDLF